MREENKELVVKNDVKMMNTLPMGEEAENMLKWAGMMSETKFYQQMTTGGGKFGILAIFGAARELGIPSFQALNGGLWIVQGRVTLSAQMMGMLIRRRGHRIDKKIGNGEICHLVGKRADTGEECEVVFTIQQADKAGLLSKSGNVWKAYPDVMLYNRALSNLAKQLFQDAIGNAVVEGEIETIDITPVKEEPADKESLMFIDRFNLIDLSCDASRFIDSISFNLGQNRKQTISQCAKEPDKFKHNLDRFIEKTKPAPAPVNAIAETVREEAKK